MKGNDISNEVVGRFLLVFEGLIADLPDAKAKAKFAAASRLRQYSRAVSAYQINDLVGRVIWDTVWRRGYSVDVVTFLGEEYIPAVEHWLEEHDLPVGNVTHETPGNLSRSLAYRPNVLGVYHSDPTSLFTYGSKGHLIDPSAPSLWGY